MSYIRSGLNVALELADFETPLNLDMRQAKPMGAKRMYFIMYECCGRD